MTTEQELEDQIAYWEMRAAECEANKNNALAELERLKTPIQWDNWLNKAESHQLRVKARAISKKGEKAYKIEPLQEKLLGYNRAICALESELEKGNDRVEIVIRSIRKPYNKYNHSFAHTLCLIKAYRELAVNIEAQIAEIENDFLPPPQSHEKI